MTTMTRSLFKKQLQRGLNAVFGMEYERHPEQWRQLFEVSNSDKAYEEDVLMVGLGAAQVKGEGAPVAYDAGAEAWTARYVHETVALAFAITQEAVEDGLYGDLGAKFARSLARSLQHTKEIKGANIFNDGFDTSVLYGDGQPLFSTSHPLWYGGTGSNTPDTQTDLDENALEDGLIAIDQFVDDRGIPAAIKVRKLAIPPALRYVAHRLLETQLRPGTADNDANAIRDMNMIPDGFTVNQRFTDSNAWFLLTDCPDGIKHMVRKSIQRGMEGDFETGNMRYKGRERYSNGVSNWRAAYGSSGNS